MLAKLGVDLSTILPAPFRQKAERQQSKENANDDT